MLIALGLWTLWTAVRRSDWCDRLESEPDSRAKAIGRSPQEQVSQSPRRATALGQICAGRCHFNPSGQGRIAAHSRLALIFLGQHNGNDGFAVITRSQDKFQV